MDQNLRVFTGKSASADSVVMPAVHSWIAESLNDIAEVKSKNDHAIIGWLCLPTAGVIGAQKWDFFVTFVCNFLHAHPVNGIVLIVHSNRASQMKSSPKVERSCMGSTWNKQSHHCLCQQVTYCQNSVLLLTLYFLKSIATRRSDDIKDEKLKPEVKEDDDSSDGQSDEDKEVEDAQVRDVKHMLETLDVYYVFFGG